MLLYHLGAWRAAVTRRCVLEVPTDVPLTEDHALKYFRDVVAGIEYRTLFYAILCSL